jgi:hypothetical protein
MIIYLFDYRWTLSILVLVTVVLSEGGSCQATIPERYALTSLQLGFLDRRDLANGVVIGSAGDLFVGGKSEQKYGETDSGPESALVARYTSDGNLQWLQTAYPTRGLDHVRGIAIDSSDNVFIAGETYRFGSEAFLVKYSAAGDVLWDRHLGSTDNEFGQDVAIDGIGNAYLVGSTSGRVGPAKYENSDAFVAKYSANGTVLWIQQLAYDDGGYDVEVGPSGSVYLVGDKYPQGALTKLDDSGNVLWSQSTNHSSVENGRTGFEDIAVDAMENLYVVGYTDAIYDPQRGLIERDALVAKYDSNGTLLWSRQLQSSAVELLSAVTVDSAGNVFVAGATKGSLDGLNAGDFDRFWAKFDANGSLLTIQQFGTNEAEDANGIAVDSAGRVYVTGGVSRSNGVYIAGDMDAYLARFDLVPEPSACLLAGVAVTLLGVKSWRPRRWRSMMAATAQPHRWP